MADRYAIHEQLGRGGMACVYRATDLTTGRTVALKKLLPPKQSDDPSNAAALFEHEFYTLAQLNHPRVISVYDYGVDGGAPFYTMELLDGGDLRDHTPTAWRQACSWMFDVGSSLALLHSRRLLHRDVSPRNIRCSQDGRAKLIDFGAMVPMSAGGARVVGTPAYIAPETLHRSALDARTDLFSLGATLYYLLTGQNAYPARNFADVLDSWEIEPVAPSTYAEDIPRELDDLVLSMLRIEPSMRPRSAFEVMQRLAAVAGLDPSESDAVTQAYLSTPTLVGRDPVLASLRESLKRAAAGQGGGVMLRAPQGMGRSRILDACVLEAKTLGATVVRASASGLQSDFTVALALAQHLQDAQPNLPLDELFPQLFEIAPPLGTEPPLEPGRGARSRLRPADQLIEKPEQLQAQICQFLLHASQSRPLLVTVDDVQRIDGPSAAVLGELIERSATAKLCVALTAEDLPSGSSRALDALAPRCANLPLPALSRDAMRTLFASVFGDVAHLGMLSDEIFAIAQGNPQKALAVAEHLIDRQMLRYASGIWTLPSELAARDLPRSAEATVRARIATLSENARFLAEAHALAYNEVFEYADYFALLPDVAPRQVDAAISDLLTKQAVVVSDGRTYTIANRVWAAAFVAGIDAAPLAQRHRALVEMYRPRSATAMVYHLFGAGLDEEGLDAMIQRNEAFGRLTDHRVIFEQNIEKFASNFPRAIDTAQRLGRSARVVADLRRWFLAASVGSDANYYWQVAPLWLQQLEHDSGLDLWRADSQSATPGERLTQALQAAQARHLAAPEHERVYGIEEALRLLAEFVVISIAIGVRTQSFPLLESLPPLLEPFAPLSPLLDAIWQNAQATVQASCRCQFQAARSRWLQVLTNLSGMKSGELQHISAIENAINFALGMIESVQGLPSAAQRCERLHDDPLQRVNALSLLKVIRLEQGDWDEATRLGRQAEELALRSRVPQMMTSQLLVESTAYFRARDLVGLQATIERVAALAARYPGWVPSLHEMRARFDLVRGDIAAAKAGFEKVIELMAPGVELRSSGMSLWIGGQTGLAEALFQLGQYQAARATAAQALARCVQGEIVSTSDGLVRVQCLADAKLGAFTPARERLDALIGQQLAWGVSGLKLGMNYEARALIEIWSGQPEAFEHYARLTAREYRYGARCPLGARYDALISEARRCGFDAQVQLLSVEPPSAQRNT